MVDVRELGEKAPIAFRRHVVDISSTGENPPEWAQVKAIATLEVDRVYRGHVGAEARLPFADRIGREIETTRERFQVWRLIYPTLTVMLAIVRLSG